MLDSSESTTAGTSRQSFNAVEEKDDVSPPLIKFNECALVGCTETATYRCSRCRTSFYCSGDHQHMHWKEHKLTCKSPEINEVCHEEVITPSIDLHFFVAKPSKM